jgi:predicted ester cyclase
MNVTASDTTVTTDTSSEDVAGSENVALATAMMEALNRGDIEGAVAAFAPGAINHGRPATPEQFRWIFTDICHNLAERFTAEEVLAAGDRVAIRYTVSGTHQGVCASPVNGGLLLGVPPTGRSYVVQHIHLFRFAGGKVVEHAANRDDLSMMLQLGLVSPPPGARPLGDGPPAPAAGG